MPAWGHACCCHLAVSQQQGVLFWVLQAKSQAALVIVAHARSRQAVTAAPGWLSLGMPLSGSPSWPPSRCHGARRPQQRAAFSSLARGPLSTTLLGERCPIQRGTGRTVPGTHSPRCSAPTPVTRELLHSKDAADCRRIADAGGTSAVGGNCPCLYCRTATMRELSGPVVWPLSTCCGARRIWPQTACETAGCDTLPAR
jgi:hypothetical protein